MIFTQKIKKEKTKNKPQEWQMGEWFAGIMNSLMKKNLHVFLVFIHAINAQEYRMINVYPAKMKEELKI